jgi:hypothetical protein
MMGVISEFAGCFQEVAIAIASDGQGQNLNLNIFHQELCAAGKSAIQTIRCDNGFTYPIWRLAKQ